MAADKPGTFIIGEVPETDAETHNPNSAYDDLTDQQWADIMAGNLSSVTTPVQKASAPAPVDNPTTGSEPVPQNSVPGSSQLPPDNTPAPLAPPEPLDASPIPGRPDLSVPGSVPFDPSVGLTQPPEPTSKYPATLGMLTGVNPEGPLQNPNQPYPLGSTAAVPTSATQGNGIMPLEENPLGSQVKNTDTVPLAGQIGVANSSTNDGLEQKTGAIPPGRMDPATLAALHIETPDEIKDRINADKKIKDKQSAIDFALKQRADKIANIDASRKYAQAVKQSGVSGQAEVDATLAIGANKLKQAQIADKNAQAKVDQQQANVLADLQVQQAQDKLVNDATTKWQNSYQQYLDTMKKGPPEQSLGKRIIQAIGLAMVGFGSGAGVALDYLQKERAAQRDAQNKQLERMKDNMLMLQTGISDARAARTAAETELHTRQAATDQLVADQAATQLAKLGPEGATAENTQMVAKLQATADKEKATALKEGVVKTVTTTKIEKNPTGGDGTDTKPEKAKPPTAEEAKEGKNIMRRHGDIKIIDDAQNILGNMSERERAKQIAGYHDVMTAQAEGGGVAALKASAIQKLYNLDPRLATYFYRERQLATSSSADLTRRYNNTIGEREGQTYEIQPNDPWEAAKAKMDDQKAAQQGAEDSLAPGFLKRMAEAQTTRGIPATRKKTGTAGLAENRSKQAPSPRTPITGTDKATGKRVTYYKDSSGKLYKSATGQ